MKPPQSALNIRLKLLSWPSLPDDIHGTETLYVGTERDAHPYVTMSRHISARLTGRCSALPVSCQLERPVDSVCHLLDTEGSQEENKQKVN